MRLRSAVSLIALSAAPALAQSRTVDEGTFVATKGGSPAFTENFKIVRHDAGRITATGHQVAGPQQSNSSLTTDTLGTPLQYELHVSTKGARSVDVKAEARAGRLTSLSSTQAGDESMRDYPMRAGQTVILDGAMVHQLYFVMLTRRTGAFHVIEPRAGRNVTATLAARGMEPVQIGGKAITGTHYSLTAGTARYELWVDARGRLLRVEQPSMRLVVTRDEAPR